METKQITVSGIKLTIKRLNRFVYNSIVGSMTDGEGKIDNQYDAMAAVAFYGIAEVEGEDVTAEATRAMVPTTRVRPDMIIELSEKELDVVQVAIAVMKFSKLMPETKKKQK